MCKIKQKMCKNLIIDRFDNVDKMLILHSLKINNMPNKNLKPGQPAPKSGQYEIIGPRGGRGNEVTSTKGHPLPPTPKASSTYKLVDATKNGSGR